MVQSNANDKITDIIEKYRKKANDYSENNFYFNGIKINGLNFTLYEISPIKNFKDCRIEVVKRRLLKGGKSLIKKKILIILLLKLL